MQILQGGAEEVGLGLAVGVMALLLVVALIVLVLAILMVVQAYKAGRSGWWVYLICLFISPLNLIAVIAWFAYFRKHPTQLGGITI